MELLKLASKFIDGIDKYSERMESEIPDFEPGFRDNFNRVYSEARNIRDDDGRERLAELKSSIEDEIKVAISIFKTFRLYIQQAFPHDYRIWEKFGYCDFEDAIDDYRKMLECFNDFHEIIEERKRELDAVHCPAKLYTDIDKNRDLLHDMVDENEKLSAELSGFKEMRLNKFNELFYLMGIVRDGVKDLFKEEPETIKLFALPVSRGAREKV
jgi:sugar-specific transcriptional regulator TrmB